MGSGYRPGQGADAMVGQPGLPQEAAQLRLQIPGPQGLHHHVITRDPGVLVSAKGGRPEQVPQFSPRLGGHDWQGHGLAHAGCAGPANRPGDRFREDVPDLASQDQGAMGPEPRVVRWQLPVAGKPVPQTRAIPPGRAQQRRGFPAGQEPDAHCHVIGDAFISDRPDRPLIQHRHQPERRNFGGGLRLVG